MSSNAAACSVLLDNPAINFYAPGAVLPLATDDPHPALTIALHDLWHVVREYLRYEPGKEPVLVPKTLNQTPRQMVESFNPALVVSFFFSAELMLIKFHFIDQAF